MLPSAEPAYIVALNSAQYGGKHPRVNRPSRTSTDRVIRNYALFVGGYPGPQCFKSITITGGSRNGHAVATIKDE